MKVTIHPTLIALLPLCVGLPCTLAGCGSGGGTKSVAESPSPSISSPVSLETLRSAPIAVTVGAKSLRLSASVFRDFMPHIGPVTTPLLAGAVTINTSDGSEIPGGLKIVSAYAYQGTTSGSFGTLTPVSSDDSVSGGMRANVGGGPALTGINSASIVVLFQDATGAQYLVQSPSVTIINAD